MTTSATENTKALNAFLAAKIEPEDTNTAPAGANYAPATDTPAEADTPPKSCTQFVETRRATMIAMMRAPEGATVEEIVAALGWQ